MKTTLAILLTSTALVTAISLPAWSISRSLAAADAHPVAGISGAGPAAPSVMLASNDHDDHDDDDDHVRRRTERDRHDDDDDDDDKRRYGNSGPEAPASTPAGAVTPQPNGLFGNGAPPRVQVK
jgi:hypothetical protein